MKCSPDTASFNSLQPASSAAEAIVPIQNPLLMAKVGIVSPESDVQHLEQTRK